MGAADALCIVSLYTDEWEVDGVHVRLGGMDAKGVEVGVEEAELVSVLDSLPLLVGRAEGVSELVLDVVREEDVDCDTDGE